MDNAVIQDRNEIPTHRSTKAEWKVVKKWETVDLIETNTYDVIYVSAYVWTSKCVETYIYIYTIIYLYIFIIYIHSYVDIYFYVYIYIAWH